MAVWRRRSAAMAVDRRMCCRSDGAHRAGRDEPVGHPERRAVPLRRYRQVLNGRLPWCSAPVLSGPIATPALASRLDGAIDLYRAGKVGHLLMSGDDSRPDYDEVTVDRATTRWPGRVPSAAITRDYASFDTYDTCIRARDIFGVTGAVIGDAGLPPRSCGVHLSRTLGSTQSGCAIPELVVPRRASVDYRLHRRGHRRRATRFASASRVVARISCSTTEVLHPDPNARRTLAKRLTDDVMDGHLGLAALLEEALDVDDRPGSPGRRRPGRARR